LLEAMETTAQIFKALSEEVRLRILGLLLDGELCVCELMAALALPQSTISRHLSYLRNAGWLVGERRGAWMYYRLAQVDGDLRRDLLSVLKSELRKLPEIKRDYEKLGKYPTNKEQPPCG
jgi:ArsR family transcriptional regulator, arsenate/arsenite/antimonite-responsive transcriptional repressor